jgi:hypothetical protein
VLGVVHVPAPHPEPAEGQHAGDGEAEQGAEDDRHDEHELGERGRHRSGDGLGDGNGGRDAEDDRDGRGDDTPSAAAVGVCAIRDAHDGPPVHLLAAAYGGAHARLRRLNDIGRSTDEIATVGGDLGPVLNHPLKHAEADRERGRGGQRRHSSRRLVGDRSQPADVADVARHRDGQAAEDDDPRQDP